MKPEKALAQIFIQGSGYARTADVLAAGIHFSELKKLVEAGIVTKIKRGHYRWEGMAFGGNEWPEVARLIPGGVFCLFSAAEFHGLTTYQPWQYHVAIERSTKVTGLTPGRVKIHYWISTLFTFGIGTLQTEGGTIRITTPERTVCDLVKYRNKTGTDTMLEVLKAYLTHKDRNLTLLLEYARKLRVEKIIRPYLEMGI